MDIRTVKNRVCIFFYPTARSCYDFFSKLLFRNSEVKIVDILITILEKEGREQQHSWKPKEWNKQFEVFQVRNTTDG